jgi:hypothetical protein
MAASPRTTARSCHAFQRHRRRRVRSLNDGDHVSFTWRGGVVDHGRHVAEDVRREPQRRARQPALCDSHRRKQHSPQAGSRLPLLVRSERVADRDSGARTGPKSSARIAALCPRRSRRRRPGPRLASGDERVGRDSLLDTHVVLARAGTVAQLGSAAVTFAEALVGSPSELPADRCRRR